MISPMPEKVKKVKEVELFKNSLFSQISLFQVQCRFRKCNELFIFVISSPRCALLANRSPRHSGAKLSGEYAPMSAHHFDATTELNSIRRHKVIQRRKSYQHSRLAKLRSELVLLRKEGASFRELASWLRKTKRIKTTHTTVMRYLEKLPELKENHHA